MKSIMIPIKHYCQDQGLYRVAKIGKVKYKNLKDELVKISNLEY